MSNLIINFADGTQKISNLHPSFFIKKEESDIESDVIAIALDTNAKPTSLDLKYPSGKEYKKVWLDNLPNAVANAKKLNQHGKEIKVLSLKPKDKKA